MSTVTLIDGREVKAGSFAHEAQEMAIDRHIFALRRLDTIGRREYLAGVARTDGADFEAALRAHYLADRDKRRAGVA